jgi:large subunit ribosomal protein L5
VSKEKQDAAGVTRDAKGVAAEAGGVSKGAEAPVKEGVAAAKPEKAAKAEGGEKQPRSEKQQQKGEKQAKGGDKQQKGQKGGRGGEAAEPKAKVPVVKDPPGYKPRLKAMYLENIAKDLKEEFSYKSVMQIPRLSKIIVSIGLGEAIENKKLLDSAMGEMSQITGRKPVKTKAKKSIATFKVRKDMDVGAMVTLRGNVMYEFLDRLVNVAMPRIKDFRGANPNAFDGHGNYSLGVTEQIIFPEIDYDKIERVSGMNIAVVTTAKTDQEARSLLARLGMPFRK